MVYKPKHRWLFAKRQERDDPRYISTAAKAPEEPEPKKSNSTTATGSVERRLLAFYTEYRPEKLLEVEDILKMYSGREEELFTALVKKYGPEPVGPNYKSRNDSVRRKSKKQVVAEARDDLHSDMSPDTIIEVPLRIRLRVPKGDESEVDRDLLEEEEEELELVIEQVFDEMLHNSVSCFSDIFQLRCGESGLSSKNESLSEQMVRAYDHFLCNQSS
jgi:hypothetical protein